jgi:arginase
MKEILLIEVKSELGAGTRGASLGIDALKIASIDLQSDFFARYDSVNVRTDNSPLFTGFISPSAKYVKAILGVEKRVCNTVSESLLEEQFPMVLAGDHSTAFGTIAGIKKAYPQKRLGVIWVDAHADLHTPYTTPSGNVHGMPLAMALAIDNLDAQTNEPPKETVHIWNEIKKIGVEGPKINPGDIVFISRRDTEAPEDYLIEKHGMVNFTTAEVRKHGAKKIAAQAIQKLKDCDLIYVSFDVDSLDPSISSGTGTPVENGLTEDEARTINTELVKNPKVCCWEMVEINPTLDSENKMAEVAFGIMEATAKSFEEARLKTVLV